MRRSFFLAPFICLGVVASTGCAAFYRLDEYTTADRKEVLPPSSDAGALDAPAAVLTRPANTALVLPGCKRNAECASIRPPEGTPTTDGGTTPAVCMKASGTCAPLLSPECPRFYGDYSSDDAVVVGTVLTASDGLEPGAFLAAEEINASIAAGVAPGVRPLVVVGCDASGDTLRATQHLVDELRVPAIVGPISGEEVVDVTEQTSMKGDTLLMTPASAVSAITRLADDGLTWRDLPSDDQRAKLVIEQMNEIEAVIRATRGATNVKLGIVHREDALGVSARDSISGKLIINGHFISDPANASSVSVDSYATASDKARQSAIATKYGVTFKPDIVFITAPEQVADIVAPLEQALTAGRAPYHPYYVCTDAAKTQAFLDAIAGGTLPTDIRRRVRGVGVRPDSDSAPILAAFESAFKARYDTSPGTQAALSYDAMCAIAFATAAAGAAPVSGSAVADGLRALAVGDSFTVGAGQAADVLRTLSTGKSVALRGTHSLLSWDASGDIAGGTVEVWCVDTGATPLFGSSGLSMDVRTQVIAGAFVQCQ